MIDDVISFDDVTGYQAIRLKNVSKYSDIATRPPAVHIIVYEYKSIACVIMHRQWQV